MTKILDILVDELPESCMMCDILHEGKFCYVKHSYGRDITVVDPTVRDEQCPLRLDEPVLKCAQDSKPMYLSKHNLLLFKPGKNKVINKNDMMLALESQYIKESLSYNSLCGEITPPESKDLGRQFNVDYSLVSHRIYDIIWEGEELYGTVELLNNPYGKIAHDLLFYFGNSSIALKPRMIICKSMYPSIRKLITFDFNFDIEMFK